MDIYLVRHGQASAGAENYDQLSQLGIKQATLLGEYWGRSKHTIDAAFCGSLVRQKHTADLVLSAVSKKPPLHTLEPLNEYDHLAVDQLYGRGIVDNNGFDISFEQYCEVMKRWCNDERDPTVEQTTVESWQSFSERGWQAIQSTASNYDKEASLVFFTSGGIIATVMHKVMDLSLLPTLHILWQTRNASITHLHIDDATMHSNKNCVVSTNAIPHLELHFDPSLITQI